MWWRDASIADGYRRWTKYSDCTGHTPLGPIGPRRDNRGHHRGPMAAPWEPHGVAWGLHGNTSVQQRSHQEPPMIPRGAPWVTQGPRKTKYFSDGPFGDPSALGFLSWEPLALGLQALAPWPPLVSHGTPQAAKSGSLLGLPLESHASSLGPLVHFCVYCFVHNLFSSLLKCKLLPQQKE